MKTTKKLAALLLCLLFAFSFTSAIASADSSAYLTFTKSGSAYTIEACSASASGVMTIPETYSGLPVTTIKENAFQNCSAITQVIIPKSVESIGNFSFADCGSLKNVTMNAETCSFGVGIFSGCDSLEIVNLPQNVIGIPKEMFKSCRSLDEIYLPPTVMAIGDEAFMNSGLTRATIPAAVISIGKNAYMSCSELAEITVESGNKNYKSLDNCIYTADGKTLIQYPAGSAAASFTVPAGVATIGDGAFSTSKNLKTVKLSSSVTSIEPYAFFDCSALTSVAIPEGVKTIGSMAFNGCDSLKTVTLPSTLTTYSNAFVASGVENVILSDGIKEISSKAFANCKNLSGVSIPDSVTTIALGAFDGCSSLETLVIPASVTTIGNGAFFNCPNLRLVVEKNSAAHDYAVKNSIAFDFPTKVVSSIAVKTMPSKVVYTAGQKLDTSGLVLKVTYNDGSFADITSGFSASADLSSAGTKTVTVAYSGKSTTYKVTVNPVAPAEKTAVSIEVAKLPNKTEYNYRDAVDITGLVIKVNYSDGTSKEITSGFITDAPSQLKPVGERVITVTYGDLKTSFTVTSSYAWWQWIIRILLLGIFWY